LHGVGHGYAGIFREFSGAGYWGSGLLVVLCALTIKRRYLPAGAVTLLLPLIAAPIAGAVAGDAGFGYFLAVRRFLWALPAAATEHRSHAAHGAVAMLVVVCTWQSGRSLALVTKTGELPPIPGRSREALIVAPPAQASLYEFFHPELGRAGCRGHAIMLAVTPCATVADRESAFTVLISDGCEQGRADIVGGPAIIEFRHCR